jgi:hypothetical protein
MVLELIHCIFWRRVGELFTIIPMIDGIRVDSFYILEKGCGALHQHIDDRWYDRKH